MLNQPKPVQSHTTPTSRTPYRIFLLFLSVIGLASAQPQYTITDLGTLGGLGAFAYGINNAGEVVGASYPSSSPGPGSTERAFRTAPNSPINPATDDLGAFGPPTGLQSYAVRINDAGQVVGFSWGTDFPSSDHAFRLSPGTAIGPDDDLGVLGVPEGRMGSSLGMAINDLGQVVGSGSTTDRQRFHAFRTAPNSPINPATDDLGTLGGTRSEALDINNAGQVVGGSDVIPDDNRFIFQAFRTAPNEPINPATDRICPDCLDIFSSNATAITESGEVVGYGIFPGPSENIVGMFKTAPNSPVNPETDLFCTSPFSVFACGIPSDINRLGHIVGLASPRGFLYVNGVMYDLNDLVPPNSGWEIDFVWGFGASINDKGQIAGTVRRNNQPRAVRLDPVVTDNVAVEPTDDTTGGSPVTITFESVSGTGTTSLVTSNDGPLPPSGFELGIPPTYYDLTTTLMFFGSAEVCIDYSEVSFADESQLRLFHFEFDTWVDRTTSLDTASNKICAVVTSFSPFAIFQPVQSQGPVAVTSNADTYIKTGQSNKNQSDESILRVLGGNRALVSFDQGAIATALGGRNLASAKLRLHIDNNANNWGPNGRTVGVHRMTQLWTESGATWNCPDDLNTGNSKPDCIPGWSMSSFPDWPFLQAPTSIALLRNGQAGWVEWDVTADVAAFLDGSAVNLGWIVLRTDEGPSGRVDFSSRETVNPPELLIMGGTPPPPRSPALISAGDTYLKQGQPNQNQGYEVIMSVQASGNNRALVRIDQAAIAAFVGSGEVESAKLRLYISDNANNWGGGRPVSVHRLLVPWSEFGATWNCPDDSNPVNMSPDCAPDWEMAQSSQWPFAAAPTSSVPHTNGLSGWVEWDVTPDVEAFLSGAAQNYGWIVKKDEEGQPGQVDYSSREGEFAPELQINLRNP